MSSEKLEREAFKEMHTPCNQRAGWISGMLGKKKRR